MTFYDLNVPWPVNVPLASTLSSKQKGKQPAAPSPQASTGLPTLSATQQQDVRASVDMLSHLGYSVCAFNVFIPLDCYSNANLKTLNPCYNFKPPVPEMDPRCQSAAVTSEGKVLQLSRVTIVLDEKCVGGKGNGAAFTTSNANHLGSYDLISVLPTDSASFAQACQSIAQPSPNAVDIITLDLATSPKLPFMLKRSIVQSAIQQGVYFEIVYSIALRSGADVPKEARRNVFAGARELIKMTNGKNIILSSGVKKCMELRSPGDVSNLVHLMGLEMDKSKLTVEGNARKCVMRGFSARNAYRGVIKGPEVVVSKKQGKGKKRVVDEEDRDDGQSKRARVEEVSIAA